MARCCFAITLLLSLDALFAFSSLSVQLDNDTFYQTDGQYSHGLHFKYRHSVPQLNGWNKWLKSVLTNSESTGYFLSYALSHQLYTPGNIKIPELIFNDRPYAGFLGFTCELASVGPSRQFQVYWQTGIVGPMAMGDDFQIWLHRRCGWPVPRGWAHQIGNEIVLQSGYECRTDILHLKLTKSDQLSARLGWKADLGNKRTSVGAVCGMRWGWGGLQRESHLKLNSANPSSLGGFIKLGAQVFWIVRDLFLDGNIFRSGHSVPKQPYRGEVYAEMNVSWLSWIIGYRHVHVSAYFKGGGAHRYGSVTLGRMF